MKIKIPTTKEIEISFVEMVLPVRYDEEDIPNDFPLRQGDLWTARVHIDSGEIVGWPKGQTGSFYMKVCDEGTYRLLDPDGNVLAKIERDYVPNNVIPGDFGDYVKAEISADGIWTNWTQAHRMDFTWFFPKD